jgi:hypothetical protein
MEEEAPAIVMPYEAVHDAARRRDPTLADRFGGWWARASRQEDSFIWSRQEARMPADGDDEAEGAATGWEDWGDAVDVQDHASLTDPASTKSMAAMRAPAVGDTREQSCAVCLEDFVAGGGELRTMPCSHSFHRQCIFKWLLVQRRCPTCRFEMPSRTDDDEEEGELVGEELFRWSKLAAIN